ncbi:MAG: molecular chaperone DnaK, partial [Candidatus Marsarchaeota archaeon]|nr:molecular chaperone DnaK [Candidatus Marsarchaeota archaeon]
DYVYKIFGKQYKPQELSAMLLQKIKADAEAYLGEPVTKAVITVPANFNDNQRQATKDAGEIAGLEVVRLVNEPTAASLAYGLDKAGKEMKILVYDLGGGTLDVTIMEFGNGVFEVKSTAGVNELGGTDMDSAIVSYLLDEIKAKHGTDISKDVQAMQRLREAAERAKIELSTSTTTEINLPFLSKGAKGEPVNFTHRLTRAKLENLVVPIVERSASAVKRALDDAKMDASQLDKIILVGGPTRMPIVQRYVEQLLSKKVERGVDPMEAVAFGAAIQAGVLSGEVKDILLLDVTPLSLCIETLGGVATKLIERNTTIPIKKSQIFTTADDMQTSVDIHVIQGERPMAKDNIELGKFTLTGIPPARRGIPQIEVTFDIDSNGILHVTAKDKGTGKSQGMDIVAPHKMSKEDIEKKMDEAKKFEEADKKVREQIELKNTAESLVYSAERALDEYKGKIPGDVEKRVNEAKDSLKDALTKDDMDAVKDSMEALKKALEEIGGAMYGKGQPTDEGHGPEGGPYEGTGGEHGDAGDQGATDTEYKVEK